MIKFHTLTVLIASTAASFALEMPSGVFRMENIEEARKLAAEKEKPLCFIKSWADMAPT